MFAYFTGSTASDATVTDKAKGTATGVKDSVFSMFGGGGKKEKKEEAADDADEPSGSSKKKADEVRTCQWRLYYRTLLIP